MKTNTSKIKGVSESLFLPLFFRAAETKAPDPLIVDPKAVEIVSQITYDFSVIQGHTLTHVATMMRVREFDRIISRCLEQNPQCGVVNIGCGLGSRYFRIGNAPLRWYELDLPEVITLRKNFFEQSDRYRFIAKDVLDYSWMDEIENDPACQMLFIAEGVLMYLPEKEVIALFKALNSKFPGAMAVFDTVTPFQAMLSHFHPTLAVTDARFKWGILYPDEVERWDDGVELKETCYYFDQPIPRLGALNFFRCLPHIARGFCILRLRLRGK